MWLKPRDGPSCASMAKWMLLSTQVGHRAVSEPRSFECDSTVKMQIRNMANKIKEIVLMMRLEEFINSR